MDTLLALKVVDMMSFVYKIHYKNYLLLMMMMTMMEVVVEEEVVMETYFHLFEIFDN
jgi:hypothetical protein